ncbi:MAG: LLM class flavin-dependent oxidoreductase [Acidimicrobiia bacterium]|nr:LLM class flavin-dependent oxidoreductase [Acidimicrobiia bacterium]
MSEGHLEIGLVLPMLEAPQSGVKPGWETIKTMAVRAEGMGFSTVWVADELLWRVPDWPGARGWWECVSMTGAVAANTSTIGVGTWVLSALHRNPGLTVKIAETLDEISNGRFLFGLGSGHAGDQGLTFGYPEDKTVGRYEEALEIIVPALRGETVSREGAYHRVRDLEIRPRGPRPGRISLMLGAHGPRTMRLAAQHADIWSAFATESSLPEWFEPMVARLDQACAKADRDPGTLERSVGVHVEPTDERVAEAAGLGISISGSPAEIAETIAGFRAIGVTRVELMLWPGTVDSLDALGPAIELINT